MLLLALRNLRARTGRTLFTAFAIALGAALIFAGRIVGVATDEANRQRDWPTSIRSAPRLACRF